MKDETLLILVGAGAFVAWKSGLFQDLSNIGSGAGSAVQGAGQGLGTTFEQIGYSAQDVQQLLSGITTATNSVLQQTAGAYNAILSQGVKTANAALSIPQAAATQTTNAVNTVGSSANTIFGNVGAFLGNVASVPNAVLTGGEQIVGNVFDFTKTIVSSGENAIKGLVVGSGVTPVEKSTAGQVTAQSPSRQSSATTYTVAGKTYNAVISTPASSAAAKSLLTSGTQIITNPTQIKNTFLKMIGS